MMSDKALKSNNYGAFVQNFCKEIKFHYKIYNFVIEVNHLKITWFRHNINIDKLINILVVNSYIGKYEEKCWRNLNDKFL